MKSRVVSLSCLLLLLLFSPSSVSAVKRKRDGRTMATPLFDASDHIKDVVDHVNRFKSARNLDVVELFGGVSNIAKEAARKGYMSATMDIKTGGANHDIASEQGFYNTLNLALLIAAGGLCVAGPPCGWWIWMSSSAHKRSFKKPMGDISKASVRLANTIVVNLVIIMVVLLDRGVNVLLEQPETSLMRVFKYMKLLIENFLDATFTWMGAFKHRLPKPTRLWSNMDTLDELKVIWTAKKRQEHERKYPAKKRKAYTYAHGGTQVNGGKDHLTTTAAYTTAFSRAVVSAWERCGDPEVPGAIKKNLKKVGF